MASAAEDGDGRGERGSHHQRVRPREPLAGSQGGEEGGELVSGTRSATTSFSVLNIPVLSRFGICNSKREIKNWNWRPVIPNGCRRMMQHTLHDAVFPGMK